MFGGSLCRGGDLMVMTVCMAIGAAILVPNFVKARQHGQLRACKSNLLTLATVCEMWAADHGDRYPATLEQVLAPSGEGGWRYLQQMPECPSWSGDHRPYLYRVIAPTTSEPSEDFELLCPDGSAHGLPRDEPGYLMSTGLQAGQPKSQTQGGIVLSWFGSWLAFVCALFVYAGALARRPERPLPVRRLLDRYPWLELSCSFSWFLLVSGAAVGLLWLSAGWPFLGLRLVVAFWLAGNLAEGTVRLGYLAWQKLSPPRRSELPGRQLSERPGLSLAGLRSVLRLEADEKRKEAALRLGLPASLSLALIVLPALDGGPYGASLGMAAVAVLSFPLSMWGKAWARTFTRRELEWIPGVEQLVEHRFDGTRMRILGTTSEIESAIKTAAGYDLVLHGEVFHLPDDELGQALAATSPLR